MGTRAVFELSRSGNPVKPNGGSGQSLSFEQQMIQQLLIAARPQIQALVRELISKEEHRALVVDYEEAGRMIGTSYEGIRKLVRKGKLKAVSRSGRTRGIAVEELKDYVRRSELCPS